MSVTYAPVYYPSLKTLIPKNPYFPFGCSYFYRRHCLYCPDGKLETLCFTMVGFKIEKMYTMNSVGLSATNTNAI